MLCLILLDFCPMSPHRNLLSLGLVGEQEESKPLLRAMSCKCTPLPGWWLLDHLSSHAWSCLAQLPEGTGGLALEKPHCRVKSSSRLCLCRATIRSSTGASVQLLMLPGEMSQPCLCCLPCLHLPPRGPSAQGHPCTALAHPKTSSLETKLQWHR